MNRYAKVQFVPWKLTIPARSRRLCGGGAIVRHSPLLGGSFSPDSRAQAIARGRTELMEMVRHMPKSSYELSLKDIVEHHHRTENQIEGGSDRGAAVGLKKEESTKIERRLSFEDEGFFFNMAFSFLSNSVSTVTDQF
ncbi:hypothetical protein SASPL_138215 [Salvia splendens]|uniref:Uncharacterized protein n=1 Tax=Salvia splendens TaxID=180675 RepID=A0A8X8WUS5_SALSN|nr:hypothetical protein SASPL_138215 [Salvia splendens]